MCLSRICWVCICRLCNRCSQLETVSDTSWGVVGRVNFVGGGRCYIFNYFSSAILSLLMFFPNTLFDTIKNNFLNSFSLQIILHSLLIFFFKLWYAVLFLFFHQLNTLINFYHLVIDFFNKLVIFLCNVCTLRTKWSATCNIFAFKIFW